MGSVFVDQKEIRVVTNLYTRSTDNFLTTVFQIDLEKLRFLYFESSIY